MATTICRSIIRTSAFVYSLKYDPKVDYTYGLAPIVLWATAEIASIIICTCFPLVPRFSAIVTHRSASTSTALTPGGSQIRNRHSGPVRRMSRFHIPGFTQWTHEDTVTTAVGDDIPEDTPYIAIAEARSESQSTASVLKEEERGPSISGPAAIRKTVTIEMSSHARTRSGLS